MYPNSYEEYDRMRKLAITIVLNYNITIDNYPLDMNALCIKMGITILPYSSFPNESQLKLLLKKSKDGFSIPNNTNSKPTIYLNDKYGEHLSQQRINHTIGHELKHILEEDADDNDDKLCDFFSKYLRCPIPVVMFLGIKSKKVLIRQFDVSHEQAGYILQAIKNRKQKFSNKYFDYEVILLKQVLGEVIEINDNSIIKSRTYSNNIFEDLLVLNNQSKHNHP